VPAHLDLAPHRRHDAVTVDQKSRAPEEFDAPRADPDPPRDPECPRGRAVRIGEDRVGKGQALDPVKVGLRGLADDAGDRETALDEALVVCAKLAQLANSAGRAVPDVEEEDLRTEPDPLPERKRTAVVRGEREVGDGASDHVVGASRRRHRPTIGNPPRTGKAGLPVGTAASSIA
jgi:hypothetical protein